MLNLTVNSVYLGDVFEVPPLGAAFEVPPPPQQICFGSRTAYDFAPQILVSSGPHGSCLGDYFIHAPPMYNLLMSFRFSGSCRINKFLANF